MKPETLLLIAQINADRDGTDPFPLLKSLFALSPATLGGPAGIRQWAVSLAACAIRIAERDLPSPSAPDPSASTLELTQSK